MQSKIERLREKANKLPLAPGVYIMKDSAGEVIYVGKAKALKNRVVSYFRGDHLPKVAAMVAKAEDFDVIIANSEFEALVLENSLIKRHKPHYNILLKDDKGYPFIRLDVKSEYPTFSVMNTPAHDGARYFGPFGGRSVSFDIIDTISKALKLPTCGRKFPRDIGKERPCLNHHMGTCAGWCLKDTNAEDYRASINDAILILEGKTSGLIKDLDEKMQQASEELRFEQAAQYRDRIRAIQGLGNRQRVIATAYADTDAIGFYRGAKSCYAVLHYTDGDLSGKDYELMDEPTETDGETLSAVVSQYYARRSSFPRHILLPCETGDEAELEQLISEAAGRRVSVEVPKRGDRLRFVETANKNAREEAERATSAQQKRLKTLEWLQKTLDLPALPERMEAFDISNTGDFGIVASMVVFVNGRPLKRDYRHFKIKPDENGVVRQDDYGSMRQVVTRRFLRYLDGDEKFASRPDLLLIDGGTVHCQTAQSVLRELGLDIPVFGMVKDEHHRTRALVSPAGAEIGLSGNPAVFNLISVVQDETHRFAIEYHKSLRKKTITSELDGIKGVGEARRNALLKHFKTMKAIKAASQEELCAAVPKNTAQAVWNYFHGGNDVNESHNGNGEGTQAPGAEEL